MGINRIGKQTLVFRHKPQIIAAFATAGPKEGGGPMRQWYDRVLADDLLGQESFELAESRMMQDTLQAAMQKAKKTEKEIDVILAGDLLNQLMSSSFAMRNFDVPFLGLYGACSTMAESLLLASALVNGGYADTAAAAASSHFSSAERQFRLPLEHGNQRPPTSQWTVTGCGAAIIASASSSGPVNTAVQVTHGTIGKVIDMGVKDINMMGAAMAPAAADTILRHLSDLDLGPEDYDMILTGDLGRMGKEIARDMLQKEGLDIRSIYEDCGVLVFSEEQDTHCGGSGCACSAILFCGWMYKKLRRGEIKRVMLVSTGALTSLTSSQQRQSIPSVAHAVTIESTCKQNKTNSDGGQ